MENVLRFYLLALSLFVIGLSIRVDAKECDDQVPPYWALTTGKDWKYEPGGELDIILNSILDLKEEYYRELQIIIRDPKTKCVLGLDDFKPDKVQLYIVVDPPIRDITLRLEALGMTYQE